MTWICSITIIIYHKLYRGKNECLDSNHLIWSAFLSHNDCIYGVHTKPSTIVYQRAGMSYISTQKFAKEELILVLLWRTDLWNAAVCPPCSRGLRREWAMAATGERFYALAVLQTKQVFFSDEKSWTVWLITTRLACFGFVDHHSTLLNKVLTTEGTGREERSGNVKSGKLKNARSDYVTFVAISVQTTRNMMPREELFVDKWESVSSNNYVLNEDDIG